MTLPKRGGSEMVAPSRHTLILPVFTLVSTGKVGASMGIEPINYEAVIADLEAKIAHLQATLAGIKVVAAMNGFASGPPANTPPSGGGGGVNVRIAPNAFFGKSIPDAAVTVLNQAQKKLSTQELMELMESGGLPQSKYNTVYAILRRRESQVGDLVNMKGEWGLASWFPNHVKKTKKDVASAAAATVSEIEEGENGAPAEEELQFGAEDAGAKSA
jgi:hypothetical protein